MRRGLTALAVGGSLLALALSGAGGALAGGKSKARAAKTKTVKVGDDYFGPAKLTVTKGTKIKWKWLDGNSNTHDVRLRKGPHGVKRFKSQVAASDYSFSRKLKKPGKYRIYCSLHREMVMTIVVKRR